MNTDIRSMVSLAVKIASCELELYDPRVIHILGASGSGTTTLGQAVCERFGHVLLDADDYFWLPTDPRYTTKRALEERQRLLLDAVESSGRCVISGSICGWGDFLTSRFDLVILVETPADVRIERLKQREHRHFGSRILPGGDMYENHTEFLAWAAKYDTAGMEMRSRKLHAEWLKQVKCPVRVVDGTRPAEEMLREAGLSVIHLLAAET